MKIGVVGYGSIGQRHAANARALGHKVLVYDPQQIGSANDVRFERNIYEECEAVVVATPTQFHEGPMRASIERGKHVLVEKPISVQTGTLPQLLDAADDKGLVVMMGNNLHFHPVVQEAKRLIDTGEIGDPLWANFVCAQLNEKYTDSVVLNWGAHEVNMALHLLGPVDQVLCASVRDGERGEEIADFVLLHASGCRSSFHLDYVTPAEIREAWIAGSERNIGMELRNRVISCGDRTPRSFAGSWSEDYQTEMEAFVDRIEGKEHVPGATGWEGLVTLRVLLDVIKKARAK